MNSTLNNSEVKNAAGTAVVFNRISTNGRSSEYQIASESPNAPRRISVKHTEIGTGYSRRRRSVLRVDITRNSTVDTTKLTNTSAYVVLDAPVGAHTSTADYNDALAYITGLLANTGGANTTIVYGGTATGSVALLNGEI